MVVALTTRNCKHVRSFRFLWVSEIFSMLECEVSIPVHSYFICNPHTSVHVVKPTCSCSSRASQSELVWQPFLIGKVHFIVSLHINIRDRWAVRLGDFEVCMHSGLFAFLGQLKC